MSNDFLAIMSSHADDCALVYAEGASRAKVIARLKACKTVAQKDESRVWLWGARMVQYVIANVKGASSKNALGLIAAEKAKARDARATWYSKGDAAARNYMTLARREAGIEASDKRGGKREGAGAKANTAKPETVAPVATPVATPATPKTIDKKVVAPSTPKAVAMVCRDNTATMLSWLKMKNSKKVIDAATVFLAALQAEIANCE